LNLINSRARIAGISVCLPRNKYRNLDYPHLSKEKIKKFISLTGIEERRISKKSTLCTSDLASKSAEKLIESLKWKKKDIEFIIFITQTSDYLTPATSIILQNKLGLKRDIYTLDINLGCSGFPYGISNAFSLINNLNFKKGLFLIGDVLSQICNFKDQSTWPLFGDGCGAVAVEKGDKTKKTFFDFYSDGRGYQDIIVPAHSLSGRKKLTKDDLKDIKNNGTIKNNLNMSLNGLNIYSFSTTVVPERLKKLIKVSKIKKDKIKYCFLHQANKLINHTIEKKLDLKNTSFPMSLRYFGNTSSATIPVTLASKFGGKTISGKSLISGFGVGLSSSNMIYEFDKCKILKPVFFDE